MSDDSKDLQVGLRIGIHATRALESIHRVNGYLLAGYEPTYGSPGLFTPLDDLRVRALSKVIDTNFKLLDKALPNLQAVSFEGSVDVNHRQDLDPMDVQAKLVWAFRQANIPIPLPVNVEQAQALKLLQ